MARRGNRRESKVGKFVGVAALIGLIGAATALVLAPGRGNFALSGVASDASGAIGGVISAPVRWFNGAVDQVGAFFGGSTLNARLRAENQSLLQWRDQAKAMAERLDAYEKLHGIAGERLPQGVTARMVAESSGPFSRAGIVNAGRKAGVDVNWVVLNQYGMVGRVISVGQDTSRVLMLDDADSRLPVMGELTRARAIALGDKTDAPRLAHLNSPAVLREGEELMTSGDDGIIPRGIAVGTAGKAPDGQMRVRLATKAAPIDFVRLVPPSSFPPPLAPISPPNLNPPPPATPVDAISTAAGGVMPLAPGASSVPVAATPEAIRAAQQEAARKMALETEKIRSAAKKLEAERDAARETARRAEAARLAAERKAVDGPKSATSMPASAPSAGPVAVPMAEPAPPKGTSAPTAEPTSGAPAREGEAPTP
jgi:rod shape-determining protein MreC